MAEERRSARRASISGVLVTYESATGDQVETHALNLGAGGLFVVADKPLAVGKRISLEVQVSGEEGPWSALGRVVWARAAGEPGERPAGMGVKLIDVEDAVVESIERLVEGRADLGATPVPTSSHPKAVPGPGRLREGAPQAAPGSAPTREKTLLGVGLASVVRTPVPSPAAPPRASPLPPAAPPRASPVPPAPPPPAVTSTTATTPMTPMTPIPPPTAVSGAAPTPSATLSGRPPAGSTAGANADGDADSDPIVATISSSPPPPKPPASGSREPSVVIDLVPNDEKTSPRTPFDVVPAADVGPTKRGGGGRWIVGLVLLALVAAGAYLVLNGYVDRILKPSENAPSAPPPAVATTVPPQPAVAPPAPRPSAASSTTLAPAPSSMPIPSSHGGGTASPALSGFAPSVTVGPRPAGAGLTGHPSPRKANGEDNNPY